MASRTVGSRRRLLILLEATLGGTRKYVIDLLNGIDKNRFQITFVYATGRADDAFRTELGELRKKGEVDLIELPMCRQIVPLTDLVCFLKLLRIIRKGKFELVHCHSSKAGFLGRLATKLAAPGTPTIYSPNAMALNISRLYKYLEKFASYFTDRIIAAANSEKQEIVENRIIAPSKIVTISLGVDIPLREKSSRLRDELKLSPQTILVVSVARCTRQKDPLTFLKAGEILMRQERDVHFAWLGNGELENEVKEFIQAHNLQDAASFIGNRRDTQELLSGADIFALASLYESFGYVTCEAMAWGIPVVATDVVGTQSVVINEVTGFLVPPQNADALADKIFCLAQDPALRSKMGENGKKRVLEAFSVRKMVTETEQLYVESLTNPSWVRAAADRVLSASGQLNFARKE